MSTKERTHRQWSGRAEVKCVLAVVLLHLERNCSDADIAFGMRVFACSSWSDFGPNVFVVAIVVLLRCLSPRLHPHAGEKRETKDTAGRNMCKSQCCAMVINNTDYPPTKHKNKPVLSFPG